MAEEKNENYEEEIEYVDENGNPIEYEYEEEVPAEEAIEYVDEEGNPVEYEEEAPAEETVEYVDEDGNPVEYEEEVPAEETVEYVDEDGNPVEYDAETAEEPVEYETDAMDVLPDGVSADSEETPESEYSGEEGEEDEDSDDNDAEKPKSFFGKLGETSPYEVMIWLAFFILLAGMILMLVKWMSYDMIVYPKYPS